MGRGMRREKHNSECIRSASERRKMYSQQYSLVVSILCPSSFCTKKIFSWAKSEKFTFSISNSSYAACIYKGHL